MAEMEIPQGESELPVTEQDKTTSDLSALKEKIFRQLTLDEQAAVDNKMNYSAESKKYYDHFNKGLKMQIDFEKTGNKDSLNAAIAAFKEAISWRKDDQKRARTYGMHFIENYNPNERKAQLETILKQLEGKAQ